MPAVEYYFYETYNVESLIAPEMLHTLGSEGWILCAVETLDLTRRYTFARINGEVE